MTFLAPVLLASYFPSPSSFSSISNPPFPFLLLLVGNNGTRMSEKEMKWKWILSIPLGILYTVLPHSVRFLQQPILAVHLRVWYSYNTEELYGVLYLINKGTNRNQGLDWMVFHLWKWISSKTQHNNMIWFLRSVKPVPFDLTKSLWYKFVI